MQHLEGSGTPFLYIGRRVLKSYYQAFALETSHLVQSVYIYRKCSSKVKCTVIIVSSSCNPRNIVT
jgi:hypothetical protein